MLSAFVLAAGLGTRLRPLTDERPKALVPVGDRTMLAHAVARVRGAGAIRVVANAHHHAEDVALACAALDVACSSETELLGTAGGLARARPLLGAGPVLVWNADVFSEVDAAALAARLARGDVTAALAVRPLPAGEGNVGVDADGLVVRLRREGSPRAAAEVAGGAFLGVHALGAVVVAGLPALGCLVGDVYLPALHGGARLAAVTSRAAFFDVGSPAAYLDANLAWLAGTGSEVWIGEGARVRAPVRRVVVGPGATVDAPLEDAVVWPGAHVVEAGRRIVVTPARTVPIG